jgi:hypothetical protein
MDSPSFASAWAVGRLMDLEHAVRYATTSSGGSGPLVEI